jgi:hypothetical protein
VRTSCHLPRVQQRRNTDVVSWSHNTARAGALCRQEGNLMLTVTLAVEGQEERCVHDSVCQSTE